jgi:hypothetical protein
VAHSRQERPSLAILQKTPQSDDDDDPFSSSDDSESDSSDDILTRRMPGFKRLGKFSIHKPSMGDEDDEDDSPAFLPFTHEATLPHRTGHGHDLSTTLRLDTDHVESTRRGPIDHVAPMRRPMPSASLTSSGSSVGALRMEGRRPDRPAGSSSTQGTPGLTCQSPQQPGSGKESSEETPSMGSSFSDLDGRHLIHCMAYS